MTVRLVSIVFSIFWLLFVFHGISIMKPPWTDDLFFILPAVNAHQGQGFAIPELTGYNRSEEGWSWHMPLFPMACWLTTLFSIELPAVRSVSVLSSLLIVLFSAGILTRLFPARHRVAYYILFLCIFGFDKSVIGSAVQGRPEPSMTAAFLIAIYLLLPGQKNSRRRILAAGFLAGLSASFHPLGLFLAGAYVPLLLRSSQGSGIVIRLKPFLLFGLGAAVPCSLSLVWLVRDMDLFNEQFLYKADSNC